MAVHNHGTEQGKGLTCSELLIGECLIKEGDEMIEGLRAERDGLLAWKANAQITLDYDKVQLDALADVIDRLRSWKINEQATASHDHEFLDKIYAAFASIEAALDSSDVDGYEHDDWVWLDEANRILDLVRAISDEFAND